MIGFGRQLYWELYRLFARRRSYIGFAIFLIFELIVFTLLKINEEKAAEGFERLAGGLDYFFSALTFAFIIVAATMLILGTAFVALVGGDIVAKETEDGNLRLILARPVSRLQLLATKFLACQIYTTILFLFVGVTALLFGILSRGWGGGFLAFWPPQVTRPLLLEWNEGMIRYFIAVFGFSLMFLPVIGLSFFLSCLKIKPAAATIFAVAIVISDWIFAKIPLDFMDRFRPYLMTSRMDSWTHFLKEDVPWATVAENTAWLLGFGLTFFIMGCIAFSRRDIKS